MKVVIVDYGSGNLRSAAKAFQRAACERNVAAEVVVSGTIEDVAAADRIVLPGVGAFADCRAGLLAIPGMWETLEEQVRTRAKPFLGICVGMQLMAERGLEHGTWRGFGWIAGDVDRIAPSDSSLKIPHMGWNTLETLRDHPLLTELPTGPEGLHAYFVHSYALRPESGEDLIARTDYGGPLTAIIAHENMVGTQFHPEKSQKLGLALIGNFLRWIP